MISFGRFNEKSLFVVALALACVSIMHHPLVIASPLMKTSSFTSSMSLSNPPMETKAGGGTASPAEYLVVEEETPIPVEQTLTKLISSQPQLRMLRPGMTYDLEEGQLASLFNRKSDQADSENGRLLARLLEEYFLSNSNSNSRLPRRLGATSKRAAAMGVDLPDYILHINKGRNFDFSSFREKMQKSG